jgi:hypothetical protein
VSRRALIVANVIAWMLLLAGALACVCWLASLREGDYVDHVTVIEHFGRPGWDWYVDFLRGEMRFVVKDYDVALMYVALPGWAVAITLLAAGAILWAWNRRQPVRARGFELGPAMPKKS